MLDHETLLEVNKRTTKLKGIGVWRELYLQFIMQLEPNSVLELGSGDPTLLSSIPKHIRRLALDGNVELAPLYRDAGIEFYAFDFDHEDPPSVIEKFDVAVCSDVFEHLLYPQKSLQLLASVLLDDGVLLSHVPNEFRLRNTLKIMLGRAESLQFFPTCDEWNYPHLRRFTDVGYRRFLQLCFKYNLKTTDLRYSLIARIIDGLGFPVPYCLEGGPTYASTNSPENYERLLELKTRIKHGKC